MKLFSLDKNYNIVWEPQALALSAFNAIFIRDKSVNKTRATAEMNYVWFFSDIKSDFQIHTDETKRTKYITSQVKGLSKTWKPDKIVKDAVKFYKENSSTATAVILMDSMYVANKLSSKMKEAVDKEGMEISDIVKLLEGVKKMPDIIKAIQESEKAVLKEIKANQDSIGNKDKSLFEDGGI